MSIPQSPITANLGPDLVLAAPEADVRLFEHCRRVQVGGVWDARLAALRPGYAVEPLRLLRHRLANLRNPHTCRVVVIASAAPREGKTVISTNLALVTARSSPHVLLIDGDLRRPSVAKLLGIEEKTGLVDALAGRVNLEEAIVRLDPEGLYVLPAGRGVADPADLLQGRALRQLMNRLAGFEHIFIDTPPVLAFADAQCFSGVADATILAVRAGLSKRSEVERALQRLSGCHLAGTVLSGVDANAGSTYYEHYYGKAHQTLTPPRQGS